MINYLYDGKDQLSKITTESAEYTFEYDAFGNTTEIKVNGISLASYNYEGGNGKLLSLTYGNGKIVRYDYDNLDRVSKIYYNNTVSCTYSYNAEGYMSEVVDYKSHIKVKYEYDTHGRNTVTNYFTFSGTNASSCEIGYAVYVDYDNIGRLSRIIYAFAGSTGSSDQLYYFPQYIGDSSVIRNWNVSINDSVDRYLYLDTDAFGRATVKNIVIDNNTLLNTEYTYDSVETEDEVYDSWDGHYCGLLSLTSDRIIRYKNTYKKRIPTGTNTEKEVSTSYNYSYDASGNITGIYKYCTETNYTNGNRTSGSSKTYYTRYTYDYLNQLIREDDEEAGYSYTYEYDNAGNRTSKKTYAYTLGTLGNPTGIFEYSYSSSGWGDRLIYDDDNYSDITYDSIGNPILIEDSDDPECYTSLTWNGRQLLSIAKYNPDYDGTISYAYNADGIRIKKEYGDWRWEYDLSGSTIIRARVYDVNTHLYTLLFMYDENGSPFAMSVKDASSGTVKTYYYEKNLQGDIVGIMNEAGYKVVSYTYDAWGNPYNPTYVYHSGVSAADRANVELNPFRYRGYYYDSETGYYYLQTRYYNPDLGRFLNADSLINQSSILGYNSFAYCLNNPINMSDSTGHMPFFLVTAAIGAVVGAIAGGIIAANNDGNVWAGIGIGAAAGALIGTGAGMAIGAALAGSIAATTGAVASGGGVLMSTVAAGGAGAGATFVANNLSQAANNIAPAAQTAVSKMQDVVAKGKAGEAASGIIKNTTRISSLTGTASYRIPDGLDKGMKILSEVKNYSGTLSYTNQLKDFVMWSQANGYQMRLYTNAKLTDPLQQLVDSGIIQLFPLG